MKIKIRGGFTLIEILIGLIITGFMSAVLINFERWLVISSQRASSLLLARDRGERVIAFIEPRILNCALGFSECREKNLFQKALGKGIATKKELPDIANWSYWPILIYDNQNNTMFNLVRGDNGVFRGTGFCVVYSRPSGLAIRNLNPEQEFLSPGDSAELEIFRGDADKLGLRYGSGYDDFKDLRSWCVLPLSGVPLHIDALKNNKTLKLTLADSWDGALKLPAAGELYRIITERFFVMNETFRFSELQVSFYPQYGYPREDGVLALWIEWKPREKIFDLYVLTEGGVALSGKTGRPSSWPNEAVWHDDFENYELCVSRASWSIKNL